MNNQKSKEDLDKEFKELTNQFIKITKNKEESTNKIKDKVKKDIKINSPKSKGDLDKEFKEIANQFIKITKNKKD
jgi:hypothetical protein